MKDFLLSEVYFKREFLLTEWASIWLNDCGAQKNQALVSHSAQKKEGRTVLCKSCSVSFVITKKTLNFWTTRLAKGIVLH